MYKVNVVGCHVPPQIHMLKSPLPQNVTVLGDRAFKEVIKVE